MPHEPLPASGRDALGPAVLVARLNELADTLSQVSEGSAEGSAHDALKAYSGALREVSAVLAETADALEAGSSGVLASQERELGTLLWSVGGSMRELSEANERVARRVGAQVVELDAVEELPPGEEAVERLRNVAVEMQEASADLGGSVESVATQLESTAEQAAGFEARAKGRPAPSLYDKQTGLHSRAALIKRLHAAVADGPSRGPWCFLVAHVDRIEEMGERYGATVGDALLFKIARITEERVREKCSGALLARWDGGVFAGMVPGDLPRVLEAAEYLREGVAAVRWEYRGKEEKSVLQTTITIGVAAYRHGESVAALVERAEEAMRRATEEGRNRVAAAES